MNETTHATPVTPAPKRWKGFSPAKAGGAAVRGIFNLALMIWTIRDVRRRRDDELNGNRKIWTLAAFAPPIGPIAYILLGRKRNASIMVGTLDNGSPQNGG
jgi:hypothetical protein